MRADNSDSVDLCDGTENMDAPSLVSGTLPLTQGVCEKNKPSRKYLNQCSKFPQCCRLPLNSVRLKVWDKCSMSPKGFFSPTLRKGGGVPASCDKRTCPVGCDDGKWPRGGIPPPFSAQRGVGGGWGVLMTIHSRSRVTIDPRISTTPRRGTSSCHRSGRHR